jgi:hypothetical protein
MSFSWEARVLVSPGRGRHTEIKDMLWDQGGSRKGVLTS